MSSGEEPTLFDLPLDPDPPLRRKRGGGRSKTPASESDYEAEQVALPFEKEEEGPGEELDQPVDEADDVDEELYDDEVGPGLDRLFSGVADLAVHVAVLIVAVAGMGGMGIAPDWQHLPALALFLLPFSFVYHVVPLAFWGQTPGMAWRELRCLGVEGEPLTVGQAILRWLASLATLLLVGLPGLLLLTGRSLADRWSRTATDFADESLLQG